jgi:hypothetical protein
MVYSESAPPSNALMNGCRSCTREQQVQIFRNVVKLMGKSPIHKHLFFKFQSITSTAMEIALEVTIGIYVGHSFAVLPQLFYRHFRTLRGHLFTVSLFRQ